MIRTILSDIYFIQHIYAMTSESILYHSTNEGQSWSNEMGKLDGSDVVRVPEQKAGVRQIILTASENQVYIYIYKYIYKNNPHSSLIIIAFAQTWFLGYGGYLWTTNDKGAHYKHHVLRKQSCLGTKSPHDLRALFLEFNFTSLKPHPYISNWALIQSATPECYRGSSAGSCIEDVRSTPCSSFFFSISL